MAHLRLWWTRHEFLRNVHYFSEQTTDEQAQADWDAVKTLCENHDDKRLRWRYNDDHGERALQILFVVQL